MNLPLFESWKDPGPNFAALLDQHGRTTANSLAESNVSNNDLEITHGTTVVATRYGGGVVIAERGEALVETGYSGWVTVEQDCDPEAARAPVDDARANAEFLCRVGIASAVDVADAGGPDGGKSS